MSDVMDEWRRGWRTVASGCCGMMMLGATSIATGIVMGPLVEDYGWSRAVISASVFITAALQLLLAPVAGGIIARWGTRRYALASAVAAGPALLLVAGSGPSEASWFAAWLMFGVVSVGLSALVWSTAWMTLFDRARGLAGAVALSGSGLAYLVFPPVAVFMTEHYGWRSVYVLLSFSAIALLLPLLLLWFKEPGDLTKIDKADRQSADNGLAPTPVTGFSLREALSLRQFWQLACVCLLVAIVEGALIIHLYPILNEGGLDKTAAAGIASLMGFAMIVGRLLSGALFDRFSATTVFAGEIILILLSCLLARTNHGSALEGASISILLGLGAGGATNAIAYLSSRYFGLFAYASIFGLLMGLFGLAFGIAPVLAGQLRDVLQSYQPIFGGCAVALGFAALLVAFLGRVPAAPVSLTR